MLTSHPIWWLEFREDRDQSSLGGGSSAEAAIYGRGTTWPVTEKSVRYSGRGRSSNTVCRKECGVCVMWEERIHQNRIFWSPDIMEDLTWEPPEVGYVSMKARVADLVISVYTPRRTSILNLNFLFKALKKLPGRYVCSWISSRVDQLWPMGQTCLLCWNPWIRTDFTFK